MDRTDSVAQWLTISAREDCLHLRDDRERHLLRGVRAKIEPDRSAELGA